MDLLKLAAQQFMQNTGSSNLDAGSVMNALKGLLGDQSGNIDLSSLVNRFKASGLSALAASWLGDGQNDALSADQLTNVFGKDKLSIFASSLGMSTDSATSGLASMIPQIIDKSSSGGSLINGNILSKAVGGLSKKLNFSL